MRKESVSRGWTHTSGPDHKASDHQDYADAGTRQTDNPFHETPLAASHAEVWGVLPEPA